jgi:hypothetical protein
MKFLIIVRDTVDGEELPVSVDCESPEALQ